MQVEVLPTQTEFGGLCAVNCLNSSCLSAPNTHSCAPDLHLAEKLFLLAARSAALSCFAVETLPQFYSELQQTGVHPWTDRWQLHRPGSREGPWDRVKTNLAAGSGPGMRTREGFGMHPKSGKGDNNETRATEKHHKRRASVLYYAGKLLTWSHL